MWDDERNLLRFISVWIKGVTTTNRLKVKSWITNRETLVSDSYQQSNIPFCVCTKCSCAWLEMTFIFKENSDNVT